MWILDGLPALSDCLHECTGLQRFVSPPSACCFSMCRVMVQWIDVLALSGDSADNIPGVKGIGIKTAPDLVRAHGDIEEVLAAAPDEKKKVGFDTYLFSVNYTLCSVPLRDLGCRPSRMSRPFACIKPMHLSVLERKLSSSLCCYHSMLLATQSNLSWLTFSGGMQAKRRRQSDVLSVLLCLEGSFSKGQCLHVWVHCLIVVLLSRWCAANRFLKCMAYSISALTVAVLANYPLGAYCCLMWCSRG